MPEINNSLAMQVNASPIDLTKTIGTISQLQLAQAHAGLYGLQSQQEARKLNALQYLKDNPTDYMGYIQQGGDPSVGSTLQGMGEKERQFSSNPLGLATENYKHVADTAKTMADTKEKGLMTGAQIAQGVLSDPSNDSVWRNAVDQHYQTHGGSMLEKQQMLGVKDPQMRANIAKAYAAQGVPPGTFAAPHTYSPTQAVTTPGENYVVPQTTSVVAPNRAPIPSSGRVMGDDEAVRTGLYDPTTEQTQRGVTPNARVTQGFGARQPTMTPAQFAESEAYGKEMAKVLPELAAKADNAKQANFTLDQMKAESESWRMGRGGNALMSAQQMMKPLANKFGYTGFDKPIADFEAFQKNAGVLTRQAVKEVSSRAAVQEFQMIQDQLPSANMTRGGFNQIADQFQAVNDYAIAKHQAAQAWRDATGSMDKFDTEWNKNISPAAFLVSRLSPENLGALKTNLERTAEGRATLQSLTKQLQWARDHKLGELAR